MRDPRVVHGSHFLAISILFVSIKDVIDSADIDLHLDLSGPAAIVLQVPVLMPLRIITNYQYRYGTSMVQAARTLYADGGWARYYHGIAPALVQGPVSRFGNVAANVGVFAFFRCQQILEDIAVPI